MYSEVLSSIQVLAPTTQRSVRHLLKMLGGWSEPGHLPTLSNRNQASQSLISTSALSSTYCPAPHWRENASESAKAHPWVCRVREVLITMQVVMPHVRSSAKPGG